MTEQHRQPHQVNRDEAEEGTTFKREGPTPADAPSGDSVEEMNRAAEESTRRNIRPDATRDSSR
jgi:hypothetical protein